MKRIISLCCVALILVSSMAVPARADDLRGDRVMLELLDYNSTNFVEFDWSTYLDFKLPYVAELYHVDILFSMESADGSGLMGIYTAWNGVTSAMSFFDLGNGLYRAVGSVPAGHQDYLRLIINGSTGAFKTITFYSVSVSVLASKYYEVEGFCHIVSTLTDKLINYVPTDEINYRYIDATGQSPYDCEFTLNLYITDWKKYDFIDFSLLLSCESITSVSASIGDLLIDFDVSEWENSNLELKDYRIYGRLDLSDVDRVSNDIPTLIITGQWAPELVNLVQVLGISAFVEINNVNPVLYYFRNLISVCVNGFDNVSAWITNQTLAFNAAIDEQTRRLELAFQGDTSGGDTSAGQKFQEDVAAKDQELDQMSSVMDSVQKPNIDQIDVSVDRFVSQADVQVLASPMAVFFEGEIFSKIIIMSILLATVSYVLYGKR